MNFSVLKRLLHYTWQSLVRNKLLSLATILVMILIVFFLNILNSVNFLANYSIASVNKKVDLTLELKEEVDINSTEVEQLKAELEQEGSQVTKISKEQALQDFKQILPDLGNFLETYRQNPLPASLYVTAGSIKDYEKLSSIVEKPEYKKLVNFDENENSFSSQKSRIYKIVDISETAKRAVLTLQILFFLIAIVIILNTVRIVVFNRSDEITIMQLVGASKSFIALPFIFEGIVYGIIGVGIGLALYILLLNVAYWNLAQILPGAYIKSFMTSLWQYYNGGILPILLQQVLLFVIVGVISSLLALNRFIPIIHFSRSRPASQPVK